MDSASEAGGVAGTVLMRFVWPHGGQSVFLSGSFYRWARLVPMSPMEGCPTIFQAVCSITPGYHQYKFLVDGEWKHDERQSCSTSECGVVNTVLFTGEANYDFIMGPELRHVDHASDGTSIDVLPRISEADLQASRHRISAYLSTQTTYELLPQSGKVVALDVDLPVKQAFHILYEKGIPMAPLWDFSKSQFVGVLSALDFILILREAGPYDTLREVALRILQNEVSSIPIIHSSSEDGSFPQLLHLASLSGILKCICRYFRHCSGTLPVLQLPICAIPVGTWVPKIGESNKRPLAMLRPSASLSSALNLLIQAQVSSIPIVDDNDSLLDIFCRSDITALAKDRVYTHINISEITIHEALQLGQDYYSPHERLNQRCQMCLRSDTLHKVMERLASPGVRRLIIVEAGSNRVEGIVTLSDIFKFLLG
ncbi:sucrose nonfermenting 4-like protein isoform X3 [Manihot esculenta]|uniref:Uncharacterized protein n=1 Tax=Manihot esculenta TaxID=3983 RepID=A0ACB7G8K6_MANES|nr:sucrose nonfermenting 4-like protein isoform X3 [Manihot esculenta]KAG8636577.1 hypothetical protein MANES_15G014200v8 [Manihot esculenta]